MENNPVRLQDRPAVDAALLVVRVAAGVIMAAHGAEKLFGAFEGPGLAATVEKMGPLGYPVTIGEFFGGLGLIVGFLSRFSAAANLVIMIGAIATVHGKNGFFLSAGGFEYNLCDRTAGTDRDCRPGGLECRPVPAPAKIAKDGPAGRSLGVVGIRLRNHGPAN